MSARLMKTKYDRIKDFLVGEGKSKNEIDHLMLNRNNLVIVKITVATRDKEEYTLPYPFVYVVKDKRNDNRS